MPDLPDIGYRAGRWPLSMADLQAIDIGWNLSGWVVDPAGPKL